MALSCVWNHYRFLTFIDIDMFCECQVPKAIPEITQLFDFKTNMHVGRPIDDAHILKR